MARALGPKHKMCRRFGVKLCDSLKCPVTRRPYRAGQHGPKGTVHMSGFGLQLSEKQKTKYIYGVLERQFESYYTSATKTSGDTGQNLLRLLELRLDNVIYRLGIAQTRRMARQYIAHGHVLVNDRKVTIASYRCSPGDAIVLKEKIEASQTIQEAKKRMAKHAVPSWLTVTFQPTISGQVVREPQPEDLGTLGIDPSLIVEFYSR